MSAVRKFWQLDRSDRRFLVKAAFWLAVYRVALWVLPWNRVASMLPSRDKSPAAGASIERLEWAVRTASRVIPSASCLTRAVTLHHLLSRAGYQSSIHLGVAKTSARGFEAHAWVEHNGITLLSSASEIAHYSRLHAFQPSTP